MQPLRVHLPPALCSLFLTALQVGPECSHLPVVGPVSRGVARNTLKPRAAHKTTTIHGHTRHQAVLHAPELGCSAPVFFNTTTVCMEHLFA